MDEINHKNLDTKRLIRNTNKFKLFYGISFSSAGQVQKKISRRNEWWIENETKDSRSAECESQEQSVRERTAWNVGSNRNRNPKRTTTIDKKIILLYIYNVRRNIIKNGRANFAILWRVVPPFFMMQKRRARAAIKPAATEKQFNTNNKMLKTYTARSLFISFVHSLRRDFQIIDCLDVFLLPKSGWLFFSLLFSFSFSPGWSELYCMRKWASIARVEFPKTSCELIENT